MKTPQVYYKLIMNICNSECLPDCVLHKQLIEQNKETDMHISAFGDVSLFDKLMNSVFVDVESFGMGMD